MPFYCVIVHGEGINFPDTDDGEPSVGFYTWRTVWAPTCEKAGSKALAAVRRRWRGGKYARGNNGSPPMLTVERSTVVDLDAFLQELCRTPGHIFYPAEETEAPPPPPPSPPGP